MPRMARTTGSRHLPHGGPRRPPSSHLGISGPRVKPQVTSRVGAVGPLGRMTGWTRSTHRPRHRRRTKASFARHLAERVPTERMATVEAFASAYTRRLGPRPIRTAAGGARRTGRHRLRARGRPRWRGRSGAGLQPRGATGTPRRSVLEVNTTDSPFLIDSLNEELEAQVHANPPRPSIR